MKFPIFPKKQSNLTQTPSIKILSKKENLRLHKTKKLSSLLHRIILPVFSIFIISSSILIGLSSNNHTLIQTSILMGVFSSFVVLILSIFKRDTFKKEDSLKRVESDLNNQKIEWHELPEYQKKLKDIYQKDKIFFQKNRKVFLKKESQCYVLNSQVLECNKNSNTEICYSLTLKFKNQENYFFRSTFEFIKNTEIIVLHSMEFVHKDILKDINSEDFDLYITNLLEEIYQEYQSKKHKKSLKRTLLNEKEKHALTHLIKTIKNTPKNSTQKLLDLSEIKNEIQIFEKTRISESSQKI